MYYCQYCTASSPSQGPLEPDVPSLELVLTQVPWTCPVSFWATHFRQSQHPLSKEFNNLVTNVWKSTSFYYYYHFSAWLLPWSQNSQRAIILTNHFPNSHQCDFYHIHPCSHPSPSSSSELLPPLMWWCRNGAMATAKSGCTARGYLPTLHLAQRVVLLCQSALSRIWAGQDYLFLIALFH